MPALAILIDCWKDIPDFDEYSYHATIDKIVETCHQDQDIKSIAMAGYSRNDDGGVYLDSWAENSESWFVNETKWDALRNSWKLINWDRSLELHQKIRSMSVRSDQVKFTALSDIHILYYCQYINPSIDKIYFFGYAWDICVKYRPVGWLQIASLQYHNLLNPNLSLLTRSSCVVFPDTNNSNILGPWNPLTDDIFQLDLNKIQW